jgi:hypothetical protein
MTRPLSFLVACISAISILLVSCAGATAQLAHTPTKIECAAYYLSIQSVLQLFATVQGRPTVTIGPASDWSIAQLKSASPSEASSAMTRLAMKTSKIMLLLDPKEPGAYMPPLQAIVDEYDAGCRQVARQEPVDLKALAEGKYPFVPPPSAANGVAANPSKLECAYYYYTIDVGFIPAVVPNTPLAALVGPSFGWADQQIKLSQEDERAPTLIKVREKEAALMPGAITSDPMIQMQPAIDYFDPPCRALAGLQPLDLKAMIATVRPAK